MKNQIVVGSNYRDFLKRNLFLFFLLFAVAISASFITGCDKDESGIIPKSSTKDVTDVKDIEAVCGGTVTADGGGEIVALGLCYTDSDKDPTVEDNYVAVGQYTHNGILETDWDFVATITGLKPTTNYKVRAYAANEFGVAYGETKTFQTKAGKTFHTLTPEMLITYTQETSEGPKENLIDGNTETYWHTAWSEGVAPLPHWIQINFPEPKGIGGFQYWFRSPSGTSGRPNSFDLQTSADGVSWTTVWESAKGLPVTVMPPAANTLSLDKNYTSKYFRIRILSTPDNTTFTHLSEFKVYHDGLLD